MAPEPPRRRRPRRRPRRTAPGRRVAAVRGNAKFWSRLALALVCLAAVGLWQWLGDELRPGVGLPTEALPHKRDALRVVTWNLENFPREDQDLEGLRRRLLDLDADVVAVQEVKNGDALRELFPEYTLALSRGGGRGHQKLGVLYDPDTIELGGVSEHLGLTLGGRVRPAFSAHLRHRDGGPDFHVVVVHLKAMPAGHEQRLRQWPHLVQVVEDLPAAPGPGRGDPDLLLLGDFNVVGGPGGEPSGEAELAALERQLGAVGVRRVPVAGGCSAYWEGTRRDAWKEPSLIDLVWIGGFGGLGVPDGRNGELPLARSGTHCALHACRPLRSTEASPDPSYAKVSDHCPVVLDLPLDPHLGPGP